jgi:flagellar biosynthesis anti-sigma factor FlgM
MRIIDTYNRFNGPAVGTASQGARAGAAPKTDADGSKAAASGGGDAVTVSSKALQLAQKSAAHADAAKVEHLRSAIEGGTFQIDRQAIAKRIVDGG